jgi:hypothetical protein
MQKGLNFLLNIQKDDGGWGESYFSCPNKKYIPLEGNRSNLVHTAWAMMGLIYAGQVSISILTNYSRVYVLGCIVVSFTCAFPLHDPASTKAGNGLRISDTRICFL